MPKHQSLRNYWIFLFVCHHLCGYCQFFPTHDPFLTSRFLDGMMIDVKERKLKPLTIGGNRKSNYMDFSSKAIYEGQVKSQSAEQQAKLRASLASPLTNEEELMAEAVKMNMPYTPNNDANWVEFKIDSTKFRFHTCHAKLYYQKINNDSSERWHRIKHMYEQSKRKCTQTNWDVLYSATPSEVKVFCREFSHAKLIDTGL